MGRGSRERRHATRPRVDAEAHRPGRAERVFVGGCQAKGEERSAICRWNPRRGHRAAVRDPGLDAVNGGTFFAACSKPRRGLYLLCACGFHE